MTLESELQAHIDRETQRRVAEIRKIAEQAPAIAQHIVNSLLEGRITVPKIYPGRDA